MMVLDCSAAMELTRSSAASRAIRDAVERADLILAPELYMVEVTSVLRKCVKAGQLDEGEAVAKARAAVELIDDFIPSKDYYVEALAEGVRLDHSTYGMFYYLLARRTSSMLATMDKALGRLCSAGNIMTVGWSDEA